MLQVFPCGSAGKESVCSVGDLGLTPRLGRCPGEGKGYPPVFWPGEFHGLYSPWGHKESDMTEQLSHRFTSDRFVCECVPVLTSYLLVASAPV